MSIEDISIKYKLVKKFNESISRQVTVKKLITMSKETLEELKVDPEYTAVFSATEQLFIDACLLKAENVLTALNS